MSLKRNIESLLFVASKPLSVKKLAQLTQSNPEEVARIITELQQDYNVAERGIQLQRHAQQAQFVSNPLSAKLVAAYLKDELTGELTDPAIETLTIVAYRGPITKSELDQIRGVNCSLILRHLLIKGLVETTEDQEQMVTRYSVSFDFLRFLGLRSIEELPDYQQLRNDENLRQLLTPDQPPSAAAADGASSSR